MTQVRLIDPHDNETIFTYFSNYQPQWEGQGYIEVIILGIIMVASIIGNSMVILGISCNKHMRTTTNLFIASLSVSDIIYVICIPFIATTRITRDWEIGEIPCRITTYIQMASGASSCLIMMSISIDRYITICCSPSLRLTSKRGLIMIIGMVLLAFCITIPVVVAHTVRTIEHDGQRYKFCYFNWPPEISGTPYVGTMLLIMFVIPLIVSSVMYYKIFKAVRRSESKFQSKNIGGNTVKQSPPHPKYELKCIVNYTAPPQSLNAKGTAVRYSFPNGDTNSDSGDTNKKNTNPRYRISRIQIRLLKMFVTIIIVFILAWMPLFTIGFAIVLTDNVVTSTAFYITVVVSFLSTVMNPIIYGFMNERFKKIFKGYFCCRKVNIDEDTRIVSTAPEGTAS